MSRYRELGMTKIQKAPPVSGPFFLLPEITGGSFTFWLAPLKAHTSATAIFIDKFDARFFKSLNDDIYGRRARFARCGLKLMDCYHPHACLTGKVLLTPGD